MILNLYVVFFHPGVVFRLGPNFLFKLEHCDRVEGENFVLKSKNIELIAVLAPLKPTLDHKLLCYTNFHGHSLCIFFKVR